MAEKTERVELKVAEALQNDVGRGIVRIDHEAMEKLQITSGDIVEILGKKITGAIVWPSHPQDLGEGIIRMDGLIRQNSGVSLGDKVKVKKGKIEEAKKEITKDIHDHEVFYSPESVIDEACFICLFIDPLKREGNRLVAFPDYRQNHFVHAPFRDISPSLLLTGFNGSVNFLNDLSHSIQKILVVSIACKIILDG